jgi:SAM-dependent methyltransferase
MTEPIANTDPFGILSSYATAEMIYAADVAGLWRAVTEARDGKLRIGEFIEREQLKPRYLRAITDYLVRVGLLNSVETDDDSVALSAAGRNLVEKDCFGHFALVVGAYGTVLHSAGDLAKGSKRYGRDLRRDPTILARASTRIGQSKLHSSYKVVLEHAAESEECVIDIGCGAGDFLSVLAEKTGAKRALGIDVLPEACELARARLGAYHGTTDVICADISDPGERLDRYHGAASLVTGLFVIHEMIGKRPGVDAALHALRNLLRPDGRLLLLEKATDVLKEMRHPPYFSEFKLFHDLTDQNLTERSHWRELLTAAGFTIRRERVLAPHTGSVLYECAVHA